MYASKNFIVDVPVFKTKLLNWTNRFSHVCILDSGNYKAQHPANGVDTFDLLAGVGCRYELLKTKNAFDQLKIFYDSFCRKEKNYLFGFFTYDLKNEVEKLNSANPDEINFPEINFFVPEIIFELKERNLSIIVFDEIKKNPEDVFDEINSFEIPETKNSAPIKLSERISKKEYSQTIEKILAHIQRGDVYELNYCQEFFMEHVSIQPSEVFEKLCAISPAPFSCFYKLRNHYLLCASPERFLKKQNNKIISQPIKGTIHRGKSEAEDLQLKLKLQQSEKEQSENVMIVDLVRNDLSRIAERGSVKVEELFGIYSFPQVHQMISTVSCEVKEYVHPVDIIKAAFPMGSMTGAPKIRAMELIEEYETTKRSIFSGAAGYFSPDGNFDFNVVIRSIFYNAINNYLSIMVGGAITTKSNAEDEYNECLLKASAMMNVLSSQ